MTCTMVKLLKSGAISDLSLLQTFFISHALFSDAELAVSFHASAPSPALRSTGVTVPACSLPSTSRDKQGFLILGD